METCPQCGYKEPNKNKPLTNAMNMYFHANGKEYGVVNSDAKEVEIRPAQKEGAPEVKSFKVYLKANIPQPATDPSVPTKTDPAKTDDKKLEGDKK